VSVTFRELQRHCRPFLKRKTFRFHRLNGFVDECKLDALKLAKAFASPGEGAAQFMLALLDADPRLQEPIRNELGRLREAAKQKELAPEERAAYIRRIRGHLIENGIYADFESPASVGLILRSSAIGNLSTFFLLGEPLDSLAILPAQMLPSEKTLVVQISGSGARLAELLDFWLNEGKDVDELAAFTRQLISSPREWLEDVCSRTQIEPEYMNIEDTLFVISMRAALADFEVLRNDCSSPQEFLCRALNMQLDAVLAHEFSHQEERKTNGSRRLIKESMENTAYLLSAVYSSPHLAYLAMLNRQLRFESIMPDLCDDIRSKGALAYLEDKDFLRNHAEHVLERRSVGKIDTAPIIEVQTSDFIQMTHMPLVEKTLYNPSLR
jgi:hypothetical protein